MRTLSTIVLICLFVTLTHGYADQGQWEGRTYTTIAPTPAEDWGAGVALQIDTISDSCPLVGSWLGGHGLFVDLIQLEDKSIVGGSLSTRTMDRDNGWRWWGSIWMENGEPLGAVGLSRAIARW